MIVPEGRVLCPRCRGMKRQDRYYTDPPCEMCGAHGHVPVALVEKDQNDGGTEEGQAEVSGLRQGDRVGGDGTGEAGAAGSSAAVLPQGPVEPSQDHPGQGRDGEPLRDVSGREQVQQSEWPPQGIIGVFDPEAAAKRREEGRRHSILIDGATLSIDEGAEGSDQTVATLGEFRQTFQPADGICSMYGPGLPKEGWHGAYEDDVEHDFEFLKNLHSVFESGRVRGRLERDEELKTVLDVLFDFRHLTTFDIRTPKFKETVQRVDDVLKWFGR